MGLKPRARPSVDPEAALFTLLELIRKRPGMYILPGRLDSLESYLRGYTVALHWHGVDDQARTFHEDFTRYIYETRGWSSGPMWTPNSRLSSTNP